MKLLIVFILLYAPLCATCQDHKIQSLFVYNFAKYIEWPENQQQGDFIIGVVATESVVNQFKSSLEGKLKRSQKIIVQNLLATNSYQQCSIIFIAEDKSDMIAKVKQEMSGSGVIVTEKAGAIKSGSFINMVQSNGKMNFEISDQLKNKNLKVSSELLRLAKS